LTGEKLGGGGDRKRDVWALLRTVRHKVNLARENIKGELRKKEISQMETTDEKFHRKRQKKKNRFTRTAKLSRSPRACMKNMGGGGGGEFHVEWQGTRKEERIMASGAMAGGKKM